MSIIFTDSPNLALF